LPYIWQDVALIYIGCNSRYTSAKRKRLCTRRQENKNHAQVCFLSSPTLLGLSKEKPGHVVVNIAILPTGAEVQVKTLL